MIRYHFAVKVSCYNDANVCSWYQPLNMDHLQYLWTVLFSQWWSVFTELTVSFKFKTNFASSLVQHQGSRDEFLDLMIASCSHYNYICINNNDWSKQIVHFRWKMIMRYGIIDLIFTWQIVRTLPVHDVPINDSCLRIVCSVETDGVFKELQSLWILGFLLIGKVWTNCLMLSGCNFWIILFCW